MGDYNFLVLKEMKKVFDRELLLSYERCLYQAFLDNSWAMENFVIIDGCRMRPPVNYDDVLICCATRKGEVVSGLAFHVNPDSRFQAEMMGFELERAGRRIAEGLSFFTTEKLGADFLKIFGSFMNLVNYRLNNIKIEAIYTTSCKRLTAFYRFFNFNPVNSIMLNGEEKFLLKFTVPKSEE